MSACDEQHDESLQRALADVEMLQAAYPDEVDVVAGAVPPQLHIHLSSDSFVTIEFPVGYPASSGVEVVSQRCPDKNRIDRVVRALRQAAQDCLDEACEGGLACCAAALEAWQLQDDEGTAIPSEAVPHVAAAGFVCRHFDWMSGTPILDRKSTFQAHACRVHTESEVHHALQQLISNSPRIQKAYHNMYAWRLTEILPNGVTVKKHDNDDDGEDAAGGRLAQLLELRREDGVMVVVSRWYGGIQLGPKRFAHITNAAREVLVLLQSST